MCKKWQRSSSSIAECRNKCEHWDGTCTHEYSSCLNEKWTNIKTNISKLKIQVNFESIWNCFGRKRTKKVKFSSCSNVTSWPMLINCLLTIYFHNQTEQQWWNQQLLSRGNGSLKCGACRNQKNNRITFGISIRRLCHVYFYNITNWP